MPGGPIGEPGVAPPIGFIGGVAPPGGAGMDGTEGGAPAGFEAVVLSSDEPPQPTKAQTARPKIASDKRFIALPLSQIEGDALDLEPVRAERKLIASLAYQALWQSPRGVSSNRWQILGVPKGRRRLASR